MRIKQRYGSEMTAKGPSPKRQFKETIVLSKTHTKYLKKK